ncbi:glycosyltransferase WbsX family protein [Mucilaginibacter arboris]|uniref:Glycosyl hydrolase n=1 Tax=Mucilaginibacter arboris TaxID=2682090 RepID=A0A7K1SXS7_9SPHI|nr:glycoside hydrolase family 99-like domain-containing protein [Mucilaginibacter arboris]MVN22047.1 glycosyl hydrolase [Mucilaginibacter arboris]
MKNKVKLIAIYLPQFHPIPENDKWWGKGFTEWTNVTKAKPQFKGHYQPHLPSDLGFYDLRINEVKEQQASMAKENGIYGFCYYHYWFNGRRILERPFNEILESGKPDFPFMLCWANENWTRVWDGGEKQVLLEQKYSEEDDREHIKYLINSVFKDSRYIRVKGKPVFCIYRSDIFPNIQKTIKIWREEAAEQGMELYLCRMEGFSKNGAEYLQQGFDAAVDFQPDSKSMEIFKKKNPRKLFTRIITRVFKRPIITKIDYNRFVNFMRDYPLPNYKQFPCVTPMWDNTSRRKTGIFIMLNSSPKSYKTWLVNTIKSFSPFSEDENFIFINAWNEWAEGNHLEPDQKWGSAFLEATKEAIMETEN